MDTIILIQGADLDMLLDNIATGMYELRVCIENGTVKFKLDNQMWSPGLGELDPACLTARIRAAGTAAADAADLTAGGLV